MSFFLFQQYLAPEVLQKQAYDRTVDWWCLGSVLFEMLYGLVRRPIKSFASDITRSAVAKDAFCKQCELISVSFILASIL